MNRRSEFDARMEQGYVRAIAWAKNTHNTRMLESFKVGLDNHRRWMRERDNATHSTGK